MIKSHTKNKYKYFMNDNTITIPKSFLHWVKSAGLRLHCSASAKRNSLSIYSLIGRGRYWRINSHNTFDVSLLYNDFERWSNSRIKTVCLPNSKAEFVKFVKEYKC